MDFDLSNDGAALREALQKECQALLPPGPGQGITEGSGPPKDPVTTCLKLLDACGYLRRVLDPHATEGGLLEIREVLAAHCPSLFLAVEVSTGLFGRFLTRYGSDSLKGTLLPEIAGGRVLGCVGLSEGGMSLEGGTLSTRAARVEGGYAVTGRKDFVVNGPIADWVLTAAGGEAGETVFCFVPASKEGVVRGNPLPLVGYEGLTLSSLSFEGARVPEAQGVLDPKGVALLEVLRGWEDEILTAAGLGLMVRAFDLAREHAKTHESGGKPIVAYQEVAFKLAEMLTLLQTSRLLAHRAAWMADAGEGEAPILRHAARVFCSEASEKISSEAMQVLGGRGFLAGNAAEEGYRSAKYLQVAGTSVEISRMKIADRLLT